MLDERKSSIQENLKNAPKKNKRKRKTRFHVYKSQTALKKKENKR